jgi:acetoin utilization deacetylase AcuC-like enzyme
MRAADGARLLCGVESDGAELAGGVAVIQLQTKVHTIPVFYSDDMLADSDSFSPSARKPKAVVDACKLAGLPIEQWPIVPATVEDLCLAHDPDFVRAVLAGESPNGFGNTREDVARSLPFTNGAMLNAARASLQSGIACAPTSGFHHAGYASAAMFCTFNGLMVAAIRLLRDQHVRRVLILDCDFHYGNGTDEIIERLDLANEIENATFGRSFCTAAQAGRYLEHLARIAGTFAEFGLILYQAGADAHVNDPLGGILDSDQMRRRDRMVFEAASEARVPLAWNLAGGYQTPVSKVVQLHLATMEECARAY